MVARGAIIPPSLALASSSGRVRLRKSDQPRGFRHMATAPIWLEIVERVSEEIIAPAAAKIDASGAFPRAAIKAMGKAGLLRSEERRVGKERSSRRRPDRWEDNEW